MFHFVIFLLALPILSRVIEDLDTLGLEDQFRKAIERNDPDVVRDILHHARIFDPNYNDGQALRDACIHGQLDIVRMLVSDERVQVDVGNNTPLMMAAINKSWEIVKLLMTRTPEVDPSIQQSFVLRHACFYGQYQIVKLLLRDKRVDPSHDEGSALTNACERGYTRVVRRLLRHAKVDPTIREANPLRYALFGNHSDVVNELILDRRLLKLFRGDLLRYTDMILSTLESLSDDRYILAIDLMLRKLLRGTLPMKQIFAPFVCTPRNKLISKRLFIEPECFALSRLETKYEQYIQDCYASDDLYPLLLISGLAPVDRVPQLIARCVADRRWDILEHLIHDGLDLIGWAWKLAGSRPSKKLRKLLNLQFKGRLAEVTIDDHGGLIMILARHQVSGDFDPYIRYLPFFGTSQPFSLLQAIRQSH